MTKSRQQVLGQRKPWPVRNLGCKKEGTHKPSVSGRRSKRAKSRQDKDIGLEQRVQQKIYRPGEKTRAQGHLAQVVRRKSIDRREACKPYAEVPNQHAGCKVPPAWKGLHSTEQGTVALAYMYISASFLQCSSECHTHERLVGLFLWLYSTGLGRCRHFVGLQVGIVVRQYLGSNRLSIQCGMKDGTIWRHTKRK